MLGRQLLSLALSAFIGISPISFSYWDGDPIEFPYTRSNSVNWRLSYDVFDMGEVVNNSSNHVYAVTSRVNINCSSACYYTSPAGTNIYGYNVDENNLVIEFTTTVDNILPGNLMNKLNSVGRNGYQAENVTYANANSYVSMTVTVPYFNGGQSSFTVYFPCVTQGMVLGSILHNVSELNDWYFLKNFLMDKDIPSSAINDVKTYIDNGDYSSAISYIENYYVNNSVTTNQNNETVVNNYTSHETTLNNLYQTENNFSTQVETDFNNRMDDIDLSPTLPQLNPFIQSANWVTAQFNRMTNNNAFGQVLIFSLVVGLLMALIGRFAS